MATGVALIFGNRFRDGFLKARFFDFAFLTSVSLLIGVSSTIGIRAVSFPAFQDNVAYLGMYLLVTAVGAFWLLSCPYTMIDAVLGQSPGDFLVRARGDRHRRRLLFRFTRWIALNGAIIIWGICFSMRPIMALSATELTVLAFTVVLSLLVYLGEGLDRPDGENASLSKFKSER